MPWRRSALVSALIVTVALLTAAQPVLAACSDEYSYGGNYGSLRIGGSTNADGVLATVDLVPSFYQGDETVVHPIQWQANAYNPAGFHDFIGYGTYHGYGTHVPGALTNCPD